MTDSRGELVTVSSYDERAASTRVRLYDWLDHTGLPAERIEYAGTQDNRPSTLARVAPTVLAAELGRARTVERVTGKTVVLSRQASPFSSGAYERSLLARAGHSVYDFDDAIYLEDSSLTSRLWSKARVWRTSVEAADIVVAGSEVLADAASAISDSVVLIPSCVEPADYVQKVDYSVQETPVAVWMGSPTTERFLEGIEEPLLALHASHGLRLRLISRGARSLGALDVMLDREDWNAATFGARLAGADLGIMPLEDTPFARGKCAYKLLQYAAAGLPVAGSPVGANRQALDRFEGAAPTSSGEWYSALESLLTASERERGRLGATARAAVEQHYSFAAWEPAWRGAIAL